MTFARTAVVLSATLCLAASTSVYADTLDAAPRHLVWRRPNAMLGSRMQMSETSVLSVVAADRSQTDSDDSGPIPLDQCVPPDTIRVTPAALDLAKRFRAAVPAGWIVAFIWVDGGRRRANKNAPWVGTGPALDLGAYRIEQIPKEAVWHDGSFPYAVLIPKEIVAKHPQKTIDLDQRGNVIFK